MHHIWGLSRSTICILTMNSNNTENQYCRLFKTLKEIEPNSNFDSKVCLLVKEKRARGLKTHLFCFSGMALFSCIATIYTSLLFVQSFFESGSSEYLSLLLSAESSFMVFWREITLSLLESVPLGALVSVLAASALFLWSITKASKDVGTISSERMPVTVF